MKRRLPNETKVKQMMTLSVQLFTFFRFVVRVFDFFSLTLLSVSFSVGAVVFRQTHETLLDDK